MGLATREARKAASAALLSWAACVRKVFEVDPVLCEKCGGEMKLVAVVLDDGGLDRILAHQGWPTDFPKTRRYEDFRSGVCAGPEGSRPKPSRAPPRCEDGSDAESQVDSGVERWDGKDEPSGEQPA